MKSLMVGFAFFLAMAAGSASARPLSSPIPPILKCDSKAYGKEQCYVIARDVPTTVAENTVLTYVDVKDSRCPLDVVCVWEGYVVASFTLESEDGSEPAQKIKLALDSRYKNTDYWVDPDTGLTVILEAVSQRLVNNPNPHRDEVKVTVGYHLKPVTGINELQ